MQNKIIGMDLDVLLQLIDLTVNRAVSTAIQENKFGADLKDEVWTRQKTAQFLQVSPDKVTEMIKRKQLVGSKIGKDYMILKSEVIKRLRKN